MNLYLILYLTNQKYCLHKYILDFDWSIGGDMTNSENSSISPSFYLASPSHSTQWNSLDKQARSLSLEIPMNSLGMVKLKSIVIQLEDLYINEPSISKFHTLQYHKNKLLTLASNNLIFNDSYHNQQSFSSPSPSFSSSQNYSNSHQHESNRITNFSNHTDHIIR